MTRCYVAHSVDCSVMLTAPARLAAFTTRITAAGFYFLAFIPFVGGIILLVFLLLPPNPQGARFDR